MHACGRRNERIHGADRSPQGFTLSNKRAPDIGNSRCDRQDAAVKALWQLITQPYVKLAAATADLQACNAPA